MLARGWQLFIHSIVLVVGHHGRDARGTAPENFGRVDGYFFAPSSNLANRLTKAMNSNARSGGGFDTHSI